MGEENAGATGNVEQEHCRRQFANVVPITPLVAAMHLAQAPSFGLLPAVEWRRLRQGRAVQAGSPSSTTVAFRSALLSGTAGGTVTQAQARLWTPARLGPSVSRGLLGFGSAPTRSTMSMS